VWGVENRHHGIGPNSEKDTSPALSTEAEAPPGCLSDKKETRSLAKEGEIRGEDVDK